MANQNLSASLFHTSENDCYAKDKKITSVDKDISKGNLCTVAGNESQRSHCEE